MNFFKLILEVPPNFTPDIINKCGRLLQAILQKNLKLASDRWNRTIAHDPDLVLLLVAENSIFLEESCKKYAFVALSSCSFKIILIWVIEIIVFYIQVAIVQIRVLGLEGPIPGFFFSFCACRSLHLNFINTSPHKLSK